METSIFPSYFHGKCQDPETGIEPAGCPNPSCPVVCGTPGSMVAHYDKLTDIAYKSTKNVWKKVINSKSRTYQKFEDAIVAAAPPTRERRLLKFMGSARSGDSSYLGHVRSGDKKFLARTTQEDERRAKAREIVDEFPVLLKAACGGESLPDCRWEGRMKEYILTFP